MGFRDFSSFNQIVIAKQGWRLLQFPESLIAKILKARYFKQTNFLGASAGFNILYLKDYSVE